MTESITTMDPSGKTMAEREGKYLTFSLAREDYGVGILKVKEIIGMLPITSVPQTPCEAKLYPSLISGCALECKKSIIPSAHASSSSKLRLLGQGNAGKPKIVIKEIVLLMKIRI
jgi:hypothetical protein